MQESNLLHILVEIPPNKTYPICKRLNVFLLKNDKSFILVIEGNSFYTVIGCKENNTVSANFSSTDSSQALIFSSMALLLISRI